MLLHNLHFPTLPSTNTWVKANLASLDPAALTLVTADAQTAGRGRLSRVWRSGTAGADVTLTLAFALPLVALPHAYQLSPLLALAARRAVGGASPGGPPLLGVKWPNDLVVGGARKVGGILAELETGPPPGGGHWAVLGLGLNVNSSPADLGVDHPLWPLTSLSAESGARAWSPPALAASVAAAMLAMLPSFFQSGFAPFQREYEGASVLLQRRVAFSEGPGKRVEGVAVGVGDDGRLLISLDDGSVKAYLSGEVTELGLVGGGTLVANTRAS